MNLKKLHQVLIMSVYGFFLCMIHGAVFSLLFAHNSHAQKSIDEIRVEIGKDKQSLATLFSTLERQTSMTFSYDKAFVDDRHEVTIEDNIEFLGDLLRWVAKERKLGFKRVDEIIYIKKQQGGVAVEEEIMSPVQVNISGTVTDVEDNEPLPGVTILVKGASRGTTTNIDGQYSLSVEQGAVLQFSYIGFVMQEVSVGNQSVINVQLLPDMEQLDEVVVVGYGTQRRRDVTGAINSIESDKIKDLPVAGLDQALQGKVAGVNITQSGGQPGGAVSVQIRGVGSIGAGSQPLYVIDGYPFYSGGGGTGQNPLNFINPADIEKVDVLKDAAATAIYGSRGANGVIMITTKSGKEGQSQIQFNFSTGIQELGKSIEMMGAEEFTEFTATARNNYYSALGYDISDDNIRRFINVGNNAMVPDFTPFLDSARYPNFSGETDWMEEVFRPAVIQNYQVSGTGGTEKVQYAISGSYFSQEGIIKGTGFNRYNLRANIDAQLTDRIRLGVNISPTYSEFDDRNTAGNFASGGIINAAMVMPPAVPIYEADGSYFSIRARGPDRFNTRLFDNGRAVNPIAPQMPGVENPLHLIDNGFIERSTFRTIATAYIDIEILEGLNFKSSLSADIIGNKGRNFTDQINEFVELPSVTQFYNQTFNWLTENTLTYSLNLNEVHRLNAMIGYTAQKNVADGLSARANEYSANFNPYIDPNLAVLANASGFESPWSLESYIARVNYVFNDKYLFTGTVRRDGSSRFGPNQRYGTFPSVAFGWRVSEESFMKAQDFVSELKLRASYGLAGNFEIGNFQWVGQVGSVRYVLGAGSGQVVTGSTQNSPSNGELTWESSAQLNIGADIGIIDNRVQFILDYYKKTTTDLLLEARLPYSSGFISFIQNIGEMVNEGWEFSVSSKNLTGAFEWSTDFNISQNRNEVTSLSTEGERLFTGGYHVTVVGEPIGSFFGYQAEGIYITQEEADAHGVALQNSDPFPGARKYADLNEDGVIDGEDRTIIGNPLPEFILGLNNRFRFQNFDLSIQLNGQLGFDVYNIGRAITESTSGFHNNTMRVWSEQYVSPEQPGSGDVPLPMIGSLWNNQLRGSHLIEDGSFVRIQNATLGYTLPEALAQKVGMKNARIYLSGQNLYTFTNYLGFDPEVSSQGTSQLLGGIDFGGYPIPRIYTLGANVTF